MYESPQIEFLLQSKVVIMNPRVLLRLQSPITNSLIHDLKGFRALSLSSSAAWNAATPNHSAADSGGCGSAVFRDPRKYARPSTVGWSMRLHNSASFIGTVIYPPKQFATKNGRFGVHTILRVKTSSSDSSFSSFCIFVAMWDALAERALLHLKPDDYIYVSGQLGSYTTVSDEAERLRYKVTAKELNYVNLDEPWKTDVSLGKETGECIRKPSSLDCRSRLQLWQIFFTSPYEWYDKRKSKKNPKGPDFVHKSTGEVLWLHDSDPPWVAKQLELLDSRHSELSYDRTSKISLSKCLSDEQLMEPNRCSSTNDWKSFK